MRLLFRSTALVCNGVAVALTLWAVLGDAAGAERASAAPGPEPAGSARGEGTGVTG
ncbi:hypothetical protein [Kitasatospora purpeofusca]|uniref:hypothetical protein n=1 Tax=Kitasatospora purpeofusca TaxID=67352 RepID=UPI0037F25D8E